MPGARGRRTGTAEPGSSTRRPRAASSADGVSRQGIGPTSEHVLSEPRQREHVPCRSRRRRSGPRGTASSSSPQKSVTPCNAVVFSTFTVARLQGRVENINAKKVPPSRPNGA